jgi:hypothetical protein
LSALGSLHPGTCAVAVASSDATMIMDLNIVHLRTADSFPFHRGRMQAHLKSSDHSHMIVASVVLTFHIL